jgi:hypothetical protein
MYIRKALTTLHGNRIPTNGREYRDGNEMQIPIIVIIYECCMKFVLIQSAEQTIKIEHHLCPSHRGMVFWFRNSSDYFVDPLLYLDCPVGIDISRRVVTIARKQHDLIVPLNECFVVRDCDERDAEFPTRPKHVRL